jgi:hypothetical protein
MELIEHAVQLTPKRGVHGVERLRPIEHQVRHMIVNRQREASEWKHALPTRGGENR